VELDVAEDEAIWDAAAATGLVLPSSCLQGWCVTCAGQVLEGEFDQSEALRYFPDDRAAGFILLCTAKPLGPMRIRTHQKLAMQAHRLAHRLPTPRG
jgi:ferredoxin